MPMWFRLKAESVKGTEGVEGADDWLGDEFNADVEEMSVDEADPDPSPEEVYVFYDLEDFLTVLHDFTVELVVGADGVIAHRSAAVTDEDVECCMVTC